ncbi:MAG: SUMF1/EgtB/PvdO family nonheme iron enzyme [Planctomycetes bacterium]|nr:SUMF1/EgtB/PvdO family nonheme iron enzyme [Planctomycetota bacterium]
MTSPSPATLTPDELEERAAIAFLEQLLADRAMDQRRTLADYAARFPRFEARIAKEWLLATGQVLAEPSAATTPEGEADHIGPYRLVRELGRGGQGVVYLANDTRLDRQVALKVLARDVNALAGPAMLRLQREADAIARLDHPGIATIFETGHDERAAWIAMRYVGGGSVQQCIAKRIAQGQARPQTRSELQSIVRLVERSARALDAAHRAGILHRDVKPANLLLAGPEEPVLVDFGLASDADSRTPTITMPGAVFGTLCYLAPERLAGATADARADVHGLGAILFELLTHERPYQRATTASELKAIADETLADVRTRNPAVPRDLAVVVATALARAPDERYQTAAALADDLARVLAHEPIQARPASAFVRLHRWMQRNPGLAAALLGLAVVLTGGLATTTWLWQQSSQALASVHRLADLKLARELGQRSAALWPARPEVQPAMLSWQREFAELAARAPLHERRFHELPAAGSDRTADWERQQLEELRTELVSLAVTAVSVQQRLDTAQTIRQRSIDDHQGAWQQAIARIAQNPRYGGFTLAPQLGLVPLGPDPQSGLEEFAHLTSGSLPTRDADGRLQLAAAAAIVLVLIPGGEAVLGAEAKPPAAGHAANVDSTATTQLGPCYSLRLEPFFLSKFEMTQEQWQGQTGQNPSTYHPGNELTATNEPRHPVELVSWLDTDRVLRELDLCLPTEAQWEWAYRAGSRSRYPSGEDERSLQGRENLCDVTSRDRGGNQRLRFLDWLDDGFLAHAPVGSFLPNAWGCHDLGGNVKEWCRDTWEDYPACAPRPGDGLRHGQFERYRIVRGGSFSSYSDEPRAAARSGIQKESTGAECGVRPARAIERP